MKTIHCGTDIKRDESFKPVKDGLRTTLIGTCTMLSVTCTELSTYISQSKLCTERVSGVYRPLKQFLFRLADLYLLVDKENPCLHWFNGAKNVFYVAVGADRAAFGKEDTATGKCMDIVRDQSLTTGGVENERLNV